jgi:hypothetical protein
VTEKRTKPSVDYSVGMKSAHCSICEHWIAGGHCEKVAGPIEPDHWCKLFHKRRQPMAGKHHEITAAHRRHERDKREMRERHNRAHHEMGHRHNQEESDLHAKQEAEMAAEELGTPGGAAPAAPGGGAAPDNPAGAPAAPGPAGGQAGAQPMPAGA